MISRYDYCRVLTVMYIALTIDRNSSAVEYLTILWPSIKGYSGELIQSLPSSFVMVSSCAVSLTLYNHCMDNA